MEYLILILPVLFLFFFFRLIANYVASILLGNPLSKQKDDNPVGSVESEKSFPVHNPVRAAKPVRRGYSGNGQRNFEKSMLHNRRIGAERFLWHGAWYYTGLKNTIWKEPLN